MKPLLVGEVNPYGTDQRYALYPEPENSAGDRLCRVIMGLTVREYLGRFERRNLCLGKWRDELARMMAVRIISRRSISNVLAPDSTVVLLGAKVAKAFRVKFEPFSVSYEMGFPVAVLPHPSGRNLLWNESDAVVRARACLAVCGVHVVAS